MILTLFFQPLTSQATYVVHDSARAFMQVRGLVPSKDASPRVGTPASPRVSTLLLPTAAARGKVRHAVRGNSHSASPRESYGTLAVHRQSQLGNVSHNVAARGGGGVYAELRELSKTPVLNAQITRNHVTCSARMLRLQAWPHVDETTIK